MVDLVRGGENVSNPLNHELGKRQTKLSVAFPMVLYMLVWLILALQYGRHRAAMEGLVALVGTETFSV